MLRWFVTVVLLGAIVHCHNEVVRSSDPITLQYLPHENNPLHGEPGKLVKLQFLLRNNGPRGTFQISQTSDHPEFIGTFDDIVEVDNKHIHTIEIDNLLVPTLNDGAQIEIEVEVTRVDQSVTKTMEGVAKTLLFTVGQRPKDDKKPKVKAEYGVECTVPRNTTACKNSQWHVEFHIKDEGSGLQEVRVKSIGKESILQPTSYTYPNFAIGTKDTVDVMTDISCCISGVTITAIDVNGVENSFSYFQGQKSSAGRLETSMALGFLTIFLSKFLQR